MQAKNKSKVYRVHQGHNLNRWLKKHDVALDTLAQQLGMDVKEVSQLEMSPVIPDNLLEKIITLFSIPLESITKRVEPLPITPLITNTTSATFSNNGCVNEVNQHCDSGWTTIEFNTSQTIYPIDKICELYERILNNKDSKLQDLEKRVADLEKKVRSLLEG